MALKEHPQRHTSAVSVAPIWGRWHAVAVSALGALVFDAFTPRGVASGTLYILAVLLVPTVATRREVLGVACGAPLLNGLGYLISRPVGLWWVGPVNRVIALGMIWGVTLLVWQRIVAIRREQQEHARWQTTVGAMGDAVVVTDATGAITFLNAAAHRLTGWSPDDAYGRPFDQVLPLSNAETHAAVVNPIQRVLAEGQVFGLANHTMLRRREGSSVPIDDSAAPIRSRTAESPVPSWSFGT